MPRFAPATITELQRVGLFASLSGETLTRLAESTERLELAPGTSFGSTAESVDVLLNGLARGAGGLARPGDVTHQAVTAVTACVVARCERTVFEDVIR